MKKIVLGILIGALLTTPGQIFADWIDAAINPVRVVVDGKKLDVENFIVDGTTYLPVRAISEEAGLVVEYDADTSTVIVANLDKPVNRYFIDYLYFINQTQYDFDYLYYKLAHISGTDQELLTAAENLYQVIKKEYENNLLPYIESLNETFDASSMVNFDVLLSNYKKLLDIYEYYMSEYENRVFNSADEVYEILHKSCNYCSAVYSKSMSELTEEYFSAYKFIRKWDTIE